VELKYLRLKFHRAHRKKQIEEKKKKINRSREVYNNQAKPTTPVCTNPFPKAGTPCGFFLPQ